MSHARDFGAESGDPGTAEHLIYDYRHANLDPKRRSLCDYAVKLTLVPGRMSEQDIHQLRSAGYSDEQVSLATQVVGYFNYINRIADGLGVDDESWMTVPHDQWKQKKGKFQVES